jgi:hypothetical protein
VNAPAPAPDLALQKRGAKHAKRHNARLERDVPLLVHAGIVQPMTADEGATRVAHILADAQEHLADVRALHERQEAEAVAAFRAAFPTDEGEVIVQWALWALPHGCAGWLTRTAQRLARGRLPPCLTNPAYWLPRSVVRVRLDGVCESSLTFWDGTVVVFGDDKDPAVRARSDELYAQCRAVLDHCAPIVSDPLLPVRLVIERPPKGPCAEKQSPLVLSPLSLRERHVRVMRHLRERPALP